MLSFEKKGQRIAKVSGPDIAKEIYIEDADLKKDHLDAYNACQLLAVKYNHHVLRGQRSHPVDLLPIAGSYLQFYGKNTVFPSADRPTGQTHVISLFGAPGSGKSTWIGKYMDDYKTVYPDGKIIVISRKTKEDEPEFRQDYQQLDIDDDFIARPFSIDDVKSYQASHEGEFLIPFLIIFDDTSTFTPAIQKKVQESVEDLIKVGRSFNVSVIVSSHVINDGAKTKVLHNASTHSVYFIQSHKEKVIETFSKRLKFGNDLTEFLIEQKSRWVCLANNHPQYVVTENLCATQNSLTDYFRKNSQKRTR